MRAPDAAVAVNERLVSRLSLNAREEPSVPIVGVRPFVNRDVHERARGSRVVLETRPNVPANGSFVREPFPARQANKIVRQKLMASGELRLGCLQSAFRFTLVAPVCFSKLFEVGFVCYFAIGAVHRVLVHCGATSFPCAKLVQFFCHQWKVQRKKFFENGIEKKINFGKKCIHT